MTRLNHAMALLWLLDRLDGDGTIEFNTFYGDKHVQANQVDLALLREAPEVALTNFQDWGYSHDAKVSVGVNLRRKGIAPKVGHDGLKWDGFGVKADIIQCSAFFVDADLPERAVTLDELLEFTPQPSLVVTSSVGRYHAYWKLAGPLDIGSADDIARYEGVQKGLANLFGFKPMNIRQVMGLPGSLNMKYDPPQMREVVFLEEKNVYSDWDEFPSVYTPIPIRDYDIELYSDGKIPQDAVDQLRNPLGRHGGRNNAIFAVAIWLRENGFSFSEVSAFIVNQCRSLSIYADFPTRDMETAIKSAFRS